jgi:hypothetical protein
MLFSLIFNRYTIGTASFFFFAYPVIHGQIRVLEHVASVLGGIN